MGCSVESLKYGTPESIVLQAELDGGSGWSVCNVLKKNKGFKEIPLVFFSVQVDEKTLLQHANLEMRADRYVLGDNPETLLQALSAAQNNTQRDIIVFS